MNYNYVFDVGCFFVSFFNDPFSSISGVPVDQLVDERQNTANLLAAALTNDDRPAAGQSLQNTDALQSLLATAAEGEDIIEDLPEYEDLIDEIDLAPVRQQQERPRAPARTRRPPGIPRRQTRPRDNDKKGQRQPERAQNNNVDTVERYSHTNEDGSFTFGYIGEDGSFREETRGVDCITRGKYGYIDPDGKKREFTYVSGLPCDVGSEEDGELADDNELQREDPISPNDRFRTSQPVQLTDAEIPDSARPRQRIPARENNAIPNSQPTRQPASNFGNFQAQPATRVRDPALRNRAPRPGQANTGALSNLLNIANGVEQQAPQRQPAQPAVVPTRPPVTRPRPAPTAAPTQRPASFDFDTELDSFTLNKPALTFEAAQEEEQERAQEGAPQATGPNFSTELVFDPASGTFKTELRQALPNGEEVRVSDDAAPSGAARPATPAPTPSALPPTQRPFTSFQSTTLRPASPAPTQAANRPAFEPLTFPSPAPTQPTAAPRPASPSPTPVATPTSPAPTQPARPAPTPTPTAGSFFFQPFPTLGSPRPITQGSPRPVTPGSPVPTVNFAQPQPARPAQPQVQQVQTQPRPVAFQQPFVNFGGAGVQQPGAPRPTPFSVFNPNFQARPTPVAPQPARPVAASPRPVAASPSPVPEAPRQASPRPIAVTPQPVAASPSPVPSSPRPASPAPVAAASPRPAGPPTVQFGFQPIQQQVVSQPAQPRPVQAGRPFTAFAQGPPPQLSSQVRPGQPRPVFQGQPQQQRPQQLGIPPQLQPQQATRFSPFGRPPPGPPQGARPQQAQQPQRPSPFSPFAVFNPAALRGARFF